MSSSTPHLMTSDEIATRLLVADMIAMRNARMYSGNVNRSVGIQLTASLTIQDARTAIGMGLPAFAFQTYLTAR